MIVLALLYLALSVSSKSTPDFIPHYDMKYSRELIVDATRTAPQIFWSCLTTILICTWVAVHPNLPGPTDSGFQRLRRQFVTMLCALMAPELMAMWAMRQRLAASRIAKEFNERFHGGVNPERSVLSRLRKWFTGPEADMKNGWTLAHGFFVQMGGILLYDDGKPLKVLTFERMLKSIERGEIDVPIIPEEEISDKSKSDFFTKSVAILQTTWFVVQCAARWHAGLPLAEMEILALAFSTLNGITYAIWWDKPQGSQTAVRIPCKVPLESGRVPRDIQETTRIINHSGRSSDTPGGGSTIESSSGDRGSTRDEEEYLSIRGEVEDSLCYDRRIKIGQYDNESPMPTFRGDAHLDWESDDLGLLFDKRGCHWFQGIYSDIPQDLDLLAERFLPVGILRKVVVVICLPPLCFYWLLYACTRAPRKLMGNFVSRVRLNQHTFNFIVGATRVPMFYAEDGHRNYDRRAALPSVVIGVIFGSLHITLWSSHFLSPHQLLLWRASALVITLEPIVVLISSFVTFFPRVFDPICLWINGCYILTLVTYLVARFILFYLSIVTLFDLPEAMEKDILWLDLLPHF